MDSNTNNEEEVNICDTCGDQGYENLLVICSKCKVGAEHTYCMMVKPDDLSDEWYCYDCTDDKDGMRKGKECTSMEKKDESFNDFLKMEERKLSQEQSDLLNTQNISESVDVGLNIDLNQDLNTKNMNVEPSSKKRKAASFIDCFKISEEEPSQADLLKTKKLRITGLDLDIDLNADPNIELNEYSNIDINVDPNINI